MTRIALAAAIAALLLSCLGLGWLLGALWRRPGRDAATARDAIADLTLRLHEAEAARDMAERRLAEIEGRARDPAR